MTMANTARLAENTQAACEAVKPSFPAGSVNSLVNTDQPYMAPRASWIITAPTTIAHGLKTLGFALVETSYSGGAGAGPRIARVPVSRLVSGAQDV